MSINIFMGLALLAALALNIYVKYHRSKKTPLGRVASILMNLNHNEKFVESFSYSHKIGRMRTAAWYKFKDKIDYLPRELWQLLEKVFEMSEEINDRVNSARKFKSDSYMAGIDISKIKEPLADAKGQLQYWLQENMNNPEYQPKRRRGLFG